MSDDKERELDPEELAEQDAELLPDREAMSVIRTPPLDFTPPPILPIEPEKPQ
jgi:hypothetical protein